LIRFRIETNECSLDPFDGVPKKSNKQKTRKENIFFWCLEGLKVSDSDEKSRIWNKMSRIQKTAFCIFYRMLCFSVCADSVDQGIGTRCGEYLFLVYFTLNLSNVNLFLLILRCLFSS